MPPHGNANTPFIKISYRHPKVDRHPTTSLHTNVHYYAFHKIMKQVMYDDSALYPSSVIMSFLLWKLLSIFIGVLV